MCPAGLGRGGHLLLGAVDELVLVGALVAGAHALVLPQSLGMLVELLQGGPGRGVGGGCRAPGRPTPRAGPHVQAALGRSVPTGRRRAQGPPKVQNYCSRVVISLCVGGPGGERPDWAAQELGFFRVASTGGCELVRRLWVGGQDMSL